MRSLALAPDRPPPRAAIRGLYRAVPWKDYDPHIKATRSKERHADPA